MRLFFPLSGDDVFISYSRKDGALYAAGLADKLTEKKLSCFIDKLGTEPNHDLPPSLKKKIKNCTVFVLVGTEKATQSEFVKKEIAEFKQTGRTILPIDFGGNVANAIWYEEIPGLAVETEKDAEALETGNPSQNVTNFVEKSFNYTRRNQFMSRMFWGALSLFFILIGLGVGSYIIANNKANEASILANTKTRDAELATNKANEASDLANREKTRADQESNRAKEQEQNANVATNKANAAQNLADEKNQLALEKTNLANEKTEIANVATRKAEEQTKLAGIAEVLKIQANKEAVKQKSKAFATQLSSESLEILSQNNPKRLKESLEKSITAANMSKEGELFLSEPIFSLRKILKLIPQYKKRDLLLVGTNWCEQFDFSTNQLIFACKRENEVRVFNLSNPQKMIGVFDLSDLIADEKMEVLDISVSDDGDRIAIATSKCQKTENMPQNICTVRYEAVIKDLQNNIFTQKTDYPNKIHLSPQGDKLVSSETKKDRFGKIEGFLKIWDIGKSEPQILNQAKTLKKEGRSYEDSDSDMLPFAGNFSPKGAYFATIEKHHTNKSATVVCIYSVEDELKRNIPIINTINVQYTEETRNIAINDDGDLLALSSNGVSVWSLRSYPKLEALISTEVDYSSSIEFKEQSSTRESLSVLNNMQGKITAESFSARSDKMSEICWDCETAEGNNPFEQVWAFMAKRDLPSGFVSSHNQLNASVDDTTITIKRKSDSAIIDKIDTEEEILSYAFSEDGTTLLTKTRKEGETGKIAYDMFHREQEYIYRQWKIGLNFLIPIAKERLRCLSNTTDLNCH
jgi:hypothetical protein